MFLIKYLLTEKVVYIFNYCFLKKIYIKHKQENEIVDCKRNKNNSLSLFMLNLCTSYFLKFLIYISFQLSGSIRQVHDQLEIFSIAFLYFLLLSYIRITIVYI